MFLSRFAQGPAFRSGLATLMELLSDGTRFLMTLTRSRAALGAEVLFLRKQLAYYQEHEVRPRRLTDAARLSLVLWSRFFNWKESLAIVTTETLIRWHRKASSSIGTGNRAAVVRPCPRKFASSSQVW